MIQRLETLNPKPETLNPLRDLATVLGLIDSQFRPSEMRVKLGFRGGMP